MEEGEPPVFQHLDLIGPHNGIHRPHEVLEALPRDQVSFDIPLEDSSRVALYVLGIEQARNTPAARGLGLDEAAARLLQVFVDILVALSERREREPMLSAARVQPVVVHAHELGWVTDGLPANHLRLLGCMLDQEGIGIVEETDDPGSPWSIEIGFEIRDYQGLGDILDYLRLRD